MPQTEKVFLNINFYLSCLLAYWELFSVLESAVAPYHSLNVSGHLIKMLFICAEWLHCKDLFSFFTLRGSWIIKGNWKTSIIRGIKSCLYYAEGWENGLSSHGQGSDICSFPFPFMLTASESSTPQKTSKAFQKSLSTSSVIWDFTAFYSLLQGF